MYGDDGRQIGFQLLGAVVIIAWGGGVIFVLLTLLNRFKMLRTSDSQESRGIDSFSCEGDAYQSDKTKEVVKNIMLNLQEF
mgnify:CR=1 FL=1